MNLDLDEIPIEQASELFRDPKKDVLKSEEPPMDYPTILSLSTNY